MNIMQRICTILLLPPLASILVDGFSPQNSCLSSPRFVCNRIGVLPRPPGRLYLFEDDDDDDDVPDVDVRNFKAPPSFGSGTGRSAPSQRKAMATKASSSASVHVCTNCGSEFVKWMGRCPTCREWNTLQEFKVERSTAAKAPRPSFGSSSFGGSSNSPSSKSWLGSGGDYENAPVRVTDVYQQVQKEQSDENVSDFKRPTRLLVPNDDELNVVLGGGIMTGSLTLIGGDPGVGE